MISGGVFCLNCHVLLIRKFTASLPGAYATLRVYYPSSFLS